MRFKALSIKLLPGQYKQWQARNHNISRAALTIIASLKLFPMKHYGAFPYFQVLVVLLMSLGGLAGPAWGQTRPVVPPGPAPHRFTYAAVVPVAGVSQAALVLRARAWAQRVTPASLAPVITSDTSTEVIRTTGICPFAYEQENLSGKTLLATLRYNATISLREGRYKYEVTGFVFRFPGSGRYPAAEIPAETFFNSNFKPLRAQGFRYETTMRTCFKEIADEVLARLLESMRQPTNKAGSE